MICYQFKQSESHLKSIGINLFYYVRVYKVTSSATCLDKPSSSNDWLDPSQTDSLYKFDRWLSSSIFEGLLVVLDLRTIKLTISFRSTMSFRSTQTKTCSFLLSKKVSESQDCPENSI